VYWNKILTFCITTFVWIASYFHLQDNTSSANANQYDIKHPLCCLRWWHYLGITLYFKWLPKKQEKKTIYIISSLTTNNVIDSSSRITERETNKKVVFFHGTKAPSGLGPPHSRSFTIALRHTTVGKTPLEERSARRTERTTPTRNRHLCPGGTKTSNPRKRAATNPRLRPQGHWDYNWKYKKTVQIKYKTSASK